ncbi:hypothetical protein EDD21DRAFT_388807 [Dissophora ornata]|nr:hypothetical protein EDD21DRAFT_388807 [Dissophora ornata]
MKSAILLAAVAISAVAAQSTGADEGRLYYTSPVTGTTWEAGKNQTVSWSNVCKSENTGNLDIVLYLGTGNLNGTEQIRVPGILPIGTLNCLKNKSATVTLPANLTTSDKYAIHVDTEPFQSYSAPFTIKGINLVTTAAPASSSTSAASTTVATTTTATTSAAGSTTSTAADSKTNSAGSIKTFGTTAAVLAAAVGSLFF